jgi:hypothetical protein
MAKKARTTPATVATTGISKQEAVRQALAALGKAVTARDLQKYIQDTFDLAMTIDHIYTAKSSVLGKGQKKAKKRKVKQPPPPEPAAAAKQPVQPAPVARKPAGGISLEDVEAVKGLLGRVGAANLKALADLLGG